MRSKVEEFCRNQFDQYLKSKLGLTNIAWDEGNEPPDYYLNTGTLHLAVEVTTIMESENVGGQILSDLAITNSLWRMVEDIEKKAKSQAILHGVYAVHFQNHIDNIRKMRPIIMKSILEYVQQTQSVTVAPEKTIGYKGRYLCSVQKLEGSADIIAPTGPDRAKWEGEIKSQSCELLRACLEEKAEKLRNITLPKVLLLYDAYHFATPEMYRSCLSTLDVATSFHTIFVSNSNQESYLLFTQAI